MTVAQAAVALEVSPALVYKLLKAGKLAHSRIGLGRGVIRIDEASLAEFKTKIRVSVAPEPRKLNAAEEESRRRGYGGYVFRHVTPDE